MSSDVSAFDLAVKAIRDGQSIHDSTAQLLKKLTIQEKLSMLTGPVGFWPGLRKLFSQGLNKEPYCMGAVERLGIPGIRFSDGPRGVALGQSTCFPISMARGATWDTSLESKVGAVMAAELWARGGNTSGSVCINLPRHPAWGRIQETYGEDPVLLGEFGVALTKSLQSNGVMACVKHYALNSIEDVRFYVDVTIDDAALHEVFLPHFEMVVKEGQVMCVMSAYNSMNGEWCGQNDTLLNKILRDMWRFEGFVISDWIFGLRDSVKSLKNGLDLEAPFAQVRTKMEKELRDGKIAEEEITRSATRLLAAQLRLYSDRSGPAPDPGAVLSQQHREVAREVASRSMVLLKNDPLGQTGHSILPIDASAIQRCAVIGVLADVQNTGDRGSSHVTSTDVITPFAGFKAALAHATVELVASDSVDKAARAAKNADFAVVVVGYCATDEGESLSGNNPLKLIPFPSLKEVVRDAPSLVYRQTKGRLGFGGDGPSMGGKSGGDRKSLRLFAKNVSLIRAVQKANPKTVVVIISSGAVIVEDWIDEVDCVVMSWYSGCEGGHALADVLLGRIDASGRLPFSIPRSEEHLPFFDPDAKQITYDKWFGQRLLDKKEVTARFPLGFGCSYTNFSIGQLQLSQVEEILQISAVVQNIGQRAGRYIAQVYGRIDVGDADFPSRVLLGFAPVDVEAGQSMTVRCIARLRPLQQWVNGRFDYVSKDVHIEIGNHAGDQSLVQQIRIE